MAAIAPMAAMAAVFDHAGSDGVRIMSAFFAGAILSAMAGYLGMMVATDGNVRTTVACTAGTLNDGLKV
eukprot:9413514-Pyramimonas_sp.AAC.2